MTIQINTIEDLTNLILSKQFSDKQIKQIIEKVLTVIFINDPPPRKRLVEMLTDYFDKYGNQIEHPIFFDDNFNIDVE